MCTMAIEDQFPQILTIIPTEVFPVTAEIQQATANASARPETSRNSSNVSRYRAEDRQPYSEVRRVVRHPQLLPGEFIQ